MYQNKIIFILFLNISCSQKSGLMNRQILPLVTAQQMQEKVTFQSQSRITYTKTISKTLGASCTNLPSCSRHTEIKIDRCGLLSGLVSGIGRFFSEPDKAFNSPYLVKSHEKIFYFDSNRSCNLW